MSDRPQIDQIFKEKLEGYQTPAPADMWDRIERSRNGAPPLWISSPIFWAAMAVLAGLIGGLIWWYVTFSPDKVPEANQAESPVLISQKEHIADLGNEYSEQVDNASEESGAMTSSIEYDIAQSESDKEGQHESVQGNSDAAAQLSGMQHLTTPNLTLDNLSTGSEGSLQSESPIVQTSATQDESGLNYPASIDLETSQSSTLNSDVVSETIVEDAPLIGGYSTLSSLIEADQRMNQFGTLDMNNNYLAGYLQPESCYAFNKESNPAKWYIDFVFAPEATRRTLESRDPELEQYRDARELTESYLFAFTTGIRTSIVWNDKFALRSGLMYSQINETFNYVDEDEQQTKVINVTVDTIVQGIDTIYIWDTLSVIVSGRREISQTNRYRMIDVPLIFGYEIIRPSYTMTINGGFIFNVLFKQKGMMLAPDLEPVEFSSDDQSMIDAFRDNLGISLFGSVGFNYNLDRRTQLIMEPQFKYYLKSFTHDQYPVKQNYVTFGLFFGIRHRI